MKLDTRAFTLAFAIWWGGCVFLLTWWIILVHGATTDGGIIAQVYLGYSFTPLGSIIGLLYGLVDGAIGGFLLAWLYNLVLARTAAST
jgi:hypothetical protein